MQVPCSLPAMNGEVSAAKKSMKFLKTHINLILIGIFIISLMTNLFILYKWRESISFRRGYQAALGYVLEQAKTGEIRIQNGKEEVILTNKAFQAPEHIIIDAPGKNFGNTAPNQNLEVFNGNTNSGRTGK